METPRILIVDDDADAARTMAAGLEARLGATTIVPDAYQALNVHDDEPFDLVIVEVALPGASGIALLERLDPPVPSIVVTWLVSPAITARAVEVGAHAVLRKPYALPEIVAAARAAIRSRATAQHVAV